METTKQMLITCPNCGNHTRVQQMNFNRGRPKRFSPSKFMPSSFQKRQVTGQFCEHCRTFFDLSKSSIPLGYYLWFGLLVAMTIPVIIILYLLIVGH